VILSLWSDQIIINSVYLFLWHYKIVIILFCFLYLAIPRMGTVLVYIQFFIFDEIWKKTKIIFSFSYPLFILVHLCSSLFFIIWYQIRALVATFIMVKIIDPSQYFSSPYHVSSQQHMVVLLVHNKRDKFLVISQKKWMILTEVVLEDNILLMSAVIVERQDMSLIRAIEGLVFHLSSSLKIIKQTVIIISRIMMVQG